MRMASRLLVGTVCGALLVAPGGSGRAWGQKLRPDDAGRKAIEQVLKKQQADWNRGDVAAFLEGYWKSPELTFSGATGVTRGWTGVLERYKKAYPNKEAMGRLEFSELEFRPLGEGAELVLGKWELQRASGNVGGVFSLVWQRFPEGWRIVHDHTSVVAK